MSASPRLLSPSTHAAPPSVLLATSCPWTTRALDSALVDAGFAPVAAPDTPLDAALRVAELHDALIIDDRVARNATQWQVAIRDASRRLGCRPMLLLARNPVAAGDLDALYACGLWGVVPYPLGAPYWAAQLAAWTRALRVAREPALSAV